MRAIVGSNFYYLLNSKSSLIIYCWEAAKNSQAAITELVLYRKSTVVILRDAFPALERFCTDGPFEDCQVRIFVKQRRTQS